MTQVHQISYENFYAFKSYKGSRKKLKNATEQHNKGNETNKNAGIKLEGVLNSMNFDYFINYISFCCEDENINDVLCKKSHLSVTCSDVQCSPD